MTVGELKKLIENVAEERSIYIQIPNQFYLESVDTDRSQIDEEGDLILVLVLS